MEKKTDLRVIKTCNKLGFALRDMLTERSFDDITVFDLCEKAGVRRATFYKHFNDKLDFLSHIIAKILDDITAAVKKDHHLSDDPVEYITDYVKRVIKFFEERHQMFNSIIENGAFPLVFDTVTKRTGKLIEENLEDAQIPKHSSMYSKVMIAGFINGGISVMIVDWLRTKPVPEDQFLDHVRMILTKLLA